MANVKKIYGEVGKKVLMAIEVDCLDTIKLESVRGSELVLDGNAIYYENTNAENETYEGVIISTDVGMVSCTGETLIKQIANLFDKFGEEVAGTKIKIEQKESSNKAENGQKLRYNVLKLLVD